LFVQSELWLDELKMKSGAEVLDISANRV